MGSQKVINRLDVSSYLLSFSTPFLKRNGKAFILLHENDVSAEIRNG